MQVAMNSATNEAISTDNDISNSKHFNPFYSSVMEFQRPCVSVFCTKKTSIVKLPRCNLVFFVLFCVGLVLNFSF